MTSKGNDACTNAKKETVNQDRKHSREKCLDDIKKGISKEKGYRHQIGHVKVKVTVTKKIK